MINDRVGMLWILRRKRWVGLFDVGAAKVDDSKVEGGIVKQPCSTIGLEVNTNNTR